MFTADILIGFPGQEAAASCLVLDNVATWTLLTAATEKLRATAVAHAHTKKRYRERERGRGEINGNPWFVDGSEDGENEITENQRVAMTTINTANDHTRPPILIASPFPKTVNIFQTQSHTW